jgi:hypothetical protein
MIPYYLGDIGSRNKLFQFRQTLGFRIGENQFALDEGLAGLFA